MRLKAGHFYRFFDMANDFWDNKVGKVIRVEGSQAIVIIPDARVKNSLTLERKSSVLVPKDEAEEITEAEYILDVL